MPKFHMMLDEKGEEKTIGDINSETLEIVKAINSLSPEDQGTCAAETADYIDSIGSTGNKLGEPVMCLVARLARVGFNYVQLAKRKARLADQPPTKEAP